MASINNQTRRSARNQAAALSAAPLPAAPSVIASTTPSVVATREFCPEVPFDDSGFALFRKLIISCVTPPGIGPSYNAARLQHCREPDDAVPFENGTKSLFNLLDNNDDAGKEYAVPPIIFKTLFNIPAEIINPDLFVESSSPPEHKKTIMKLIADSLNTTNFGCHNNDYDTSGCEFAEGQPRVIPPGLIKYTRNFDFNGTATNILSDITDRPLIPNTNNKYQVTFNSDIENALTSNSSPLLSEHPFYIAINLFNSSTKSASHTAAIIVYRKELYSIGLTNWASENQSVSHLAPRLDAKIQSPEDYVKTILFNVQEGDISKNKKSRIALQNYQIIDIDLVDVDIVRKLNVYFSDMVQIKAIPHFQLEKKKPKLVYWDAELDAEPSALTYSRINNCLYNYLPIDPTEYVSDPDKAKYVSSLPVGVVCSAITKICGFDMSTSVGVGVGALATSALTMKPITITAPTINQANRPPTTNRANNHYVKTTNCSGFIESIFGVNCHKLLTHGSTGIGLAKTVSAPTTCWLRLDNRALQGVIAAIDNDSFDDFKLALKNKPQWFNASLHGGNNKNKKTRKYKTRKYKKGKYKKGKYKTRGTKKNKM